MNIQIADDLYDKAGTLVPEDTCEITIEKYSYLLSDSVHLMIQEVLSEHPLPYKLQDFQLLTLHCLGSLKNVVLVAPTGCGKMLCSYYGILVLLKGFNICNGVGLLSQHLSALMEEKLKNPPMTGEVKISKDAQTELSSEPSEQCKAGDITLLIGHPESWVTDTAVEILDTLKSEELVIGTFVDEFQMNLANHWGSDFRLVTSGKNM